MPSHPARSECGGRDIQAASSSELTPILEGVNADKGGDVSTGYTALSQGVSPPDKSGQQRQLRMLLLVVAGLTLVVLAFFSSYASALGNPTPRHIPVAVAASRAAVTKLEASPVLSVHRVADLGRGGQLVQDRAVDGALAYAGAGPVTLLVAGGGGHQVAIILMQLGQQLARARGGALITRDVAPTSPNDPTGTVEFYCLVFLFLGAAIGSSALGRILGPVRRLPDALRRLGWALVYAGLLSLVITFFADVVFGALIGHFWILFLTLWLYASAVCLAVSGVATQAGMAASTVLILVIVGLGNPSSGGPLPRPLLNSFYSGLNPVMPQGAAMSALRGVQYFGDHGIALGVLCLMAWAMAGLALLVAKGLGWPPRHAAADS
jgi:hypothetical protein